MKLSLFSTGLLLAITISASADDNKPTAVSLTELDDRLRIELNGELFTEYLFEREDGFFPAFYPVMGPDEVAMTRKYPFEEIEDEDKDHPHHQSLWFAHSNVNGETFWAVRSYKDRKTGKMRVPGRQVHQGFKEVVSGDESGHFVAETKYVASNGRTVMSDTRTVRIPSVADAMAPRIIDIEIEFHATDGDVVFGDEKDAGMAIRLASELQVEKRIKENPKNMNSATGHLLNSEGVSGRETWGKRARWVDAYGEVGGKPVGVAILDHPENPRHPTWWHSRTYGLVTANIFGKHFFEKLEDPKAGEFTLEDGKSVAFRWRFVFHRDGPKEADIDRQFEKFADE
ncbi:MAG: PmoA family protein [Verrucomicrobiae bacterium]|nr:PmoA family protein [Verrucomicrobiae bacterium]